MAYTSLFKQSDVRVTTPFSTTHKGLDLSRGVVEQPIYLPNKAIKGTVWKILPAYSTGGVYYPNSPIIYVKHQDGSGSRYIHSYPRNVKVKVGDTVVAGQQICATGNSGHSFGDHLHFEWLTKWDDLTTRVDPAPFVMNDLEPSFKVGDTVLWTATQNVRKGSGTSYEVLKQTTVGEKATIKDGPRVSDGYVWFDMAFDIGGSGWVAEVNKFEVYVKPPVPSPCIEYIKQVELLQNQVQSLNERVAFLEDTLLTREKELKALEEDYTRIKGERDKFEAEYMAVVAELNELKQGRDTWINKIADVLHKLFGMNK